jgi:hypothetical protein
MMRKVQMMMRSVLMTESGDDEMSGDDCEEDSEKKKLERSITMVRNMNMMVI